MIGDLDQTVLSGVVVAAAMAAGIATYNVAVWIMAKRKTGLWTHVGFSGFSDATRVLLKRIAR